MAIYHLCAKIITRSNGRFSTAASAYRAGERILDERTGLTFDYTKKKDVSYKKILFPSYSPSWVSERSKLWNEAEKKRLEKTLK